jgi:hypothetical protein
MLAAALEDEVAAYIAAHVAKRDKQGRRLVVRNEHARGAAGHHRSRCGRGAGPAGG